MSSIGQVPNPGCLNPPYDPGAKQPQEGACNNSLKLSDNLAEDEEKCDDQLPVADTKGDLKLSKDIKSNLPEVDQIIQNLKMESHIEGGYFKEDCKSDMKMPDPITGKEDRAIFTTCYYLLPQGQRSIFHRLLSSDEIWSYQKGDPIILFEIQENGEFIKTLIGPDLHRGHKLKSQSEEKYMDGS